MCYFITLANAQRADVKLSFCYDVERDNIKLAKYILTRKSVIVAIIATTLRKWHARKVRKKFRKFKIDFVHSKLRHFAL